MSPGMRNLWRGLIVFWVIALAFHVKLWMSPYGRTPLWTFATPFIGMLAPAIQLHRDARIRRQILNRAKLGLCMHCGYDLRATPTRCPECGAEAEEFSSRLD
jgi:hypothetical protein